MTKAETKVRAQQIVLTQLEMGFLLQQARAEKAGHPIQRCPFPRILRLKLVTEKRLDKQAYRSRIEEKRQTLRDAAIGGRGKVLVELAHEINNKESYLKGPWFHYVLTDKGNGLVDSVSVRMPRSRGRGQYQI